jgi:hypothetical protein
MAADQGDRHVACVNTWLDRGKSNPQPQLLDAFQEAFDALWARAHRSLGDVTLTAIVDRVLSNASEVIPALGTIHVEPRRLLFLDFRAQAAHLPRAELVDAIRFVLVEFLRVIGNLTAEIMTPALHSELINAPRAKKARTQGVQGKARTRGKRARTP